jgi:hypothetical protein
VYIALAMIIFLTVKSGKGKMLIVICLICIITAYSFFSFFSSSIKTRDLIFQHLFNFTADYEKLTKMKQGSFRVYGRETACSIFFDHLLLGAGPGTFGNAFSFVMPSPVYKEYGLKGYMYRFMCKLRSLDQFWFQSLAELGIIGIISVLGFLVLIFYTLFIAHRRCPDPWLKKWLQGCSLGILIILIYTNGSGINMNEFIVMWAAFSGMGLGALQAADKSHKLN